jgi:hypothetical protein
MKLEDKVFFMYQNKIEQGVIIEITQNRFGFIYCIEFYDNESEPCKVKLDESKLFITIYKLLENLEDDFYIKTGELSKHE